MSGVPIRDELAGDCRKRRLRRAAHGHKEFVRINDGAWPKRPGCSTLDAGPSFWKGPRPLSNSSFPSLATSRLPFPLPATSTLCFSPQFPPPPHPFASQQRLPLIVCALALGHGNSDQFLGTRSSEGHAGCEVWRDPVRSVRLSKFQARGEARADGRLRSRQKASC